MYELFNCTCTYCSSLLLLFCVGMLLLLLLSSLACGLSFVMLVLAFEFFVLSFVFCFIPHVLSRFW